MKKCRELIHLTHFKEICSFFPDGEIEKTEKPDFIVHTPHKKLGIEHTEIFQPGIPNGESLQAQDSLAQRVVDEANKLYLQNHSQPLWIQVLFNSKVKIIKQDVHRIAEMVVQLIEVAPIESGEYIILKRNSDNSKYFPQEIAMIHMQPTKRDNMWRCSSIGSVPELTQQQLQEKIDKKEQKLDSYTQNCSEIWLLIVADDLRIPSSVGLTQSASTYQYNTRFDRAFFFWNSSRRYIELTRSHAPRGDV